MSVVAALDLRASLAEVVARSRVEPEYFCRTVLRSPSDDWQAEVMAAVADLERARLGLPTFVNHGLKNRFTVRSGHGAGKTNVLARLMHWYQFTHPQGLVPCTAPKERQLLTRLWPEARRLLASAASWYRRLVDAQVGGKVIWGNDPDWVAIAETASEPENLAGYHAPHLLFLVDEGSAERLDAMFPVIEGALTTEGALLVMIGNPTRTRGEFYASHCRAGVRELYYRVHVPPSRAQRPGLRRWADLMVRKYGRQSAVVKVRVMGEFAETADHQLLPLSWIAAARDREPEDDGSLPRLRVTVDVADGGDDETVVTAAWLYDTRTLFRKQERHSFEASESPLAAADAAEEMFRRFGGRKDRDDIVVDALGPGSGTAGTLRRRGYRVVRYVGGAASANPQRWRNVRTQSYLVLRDALRDGAMAYHERYYDDPADWDDHDAQLTSILTKPGQERVEELETKADLLRRGVKSPDLADGEAMVFARSLPTEALGSTVVATGGELETAGSNWEEAF